MPYVEFKNKMDRVKKEYIVTITTNGNIAFNSRCCLEILKDYRYSILLYDGGKRRMGIKVTGKKKENADKTSASLSGRAFLKSFDIDYSRKRRFLVNWDIKKELLEIELTKEISLNKVEK